MMNEKGLDRNKIEVLLKIYETEWKDIMHCRVQDWKSLNLSIISLGGLFGLSLKEDLLNIAGVLAIFVCLFAINGLGIAYRHRKLFKKKMSVIMNIERELGMYRLGILPQEWETKDWPKTWTIKWGTVSFFIMFMQLSIVFISLYCFVVLP